MWMQLKARPNVQVSAQQLQRLLQPLELLANTNITTY